MITGGIAAALEPRVPQPAHDVVAIAVLVPDDGEHGEVEHPNSGAGGLHP